MTVEPSKEAVNAAAREAGISTYEARAALTAAAPLIEAEALREALRSLPTNFTEYTDAEVGFDEFADGVTAVYDWLRARAATILEGTSE